MFDNKIMNRIVTNQQKKYQEFPKNIRDQNEGKIKEITFENQIS